MSSTSKKLNLLLRKSTMFPSWHKIILSVVLIVAMLVTLPTLSKTYIPTNRDTRKAPDKAEYTLTKLNGYEKLYETQNFIFSYREDRDIIAIEDKRNGYTWKTGIDVPYADELKKNIKKAKTDEEIIAASEPKEKSLNSTYIGVANSLLTVEYSENETTKIISSASESGASSKLYRENSDGSVWRLEADLKAIDLKLNVYVTFGDGTISYRVPYEEMSGEGMQSMTSVILTPFLGASGGEAQFFDPEIGEYGDTVDKYRVPGYVMVPDGSGALIRFKDNNVAFTPYVGDVYGSDPSTETYYYSSLTDAVPVKSPVMPVFGIAHGDNQAAFVAWADEGSEYMEIIVNPDETKKVKYTWAYPRFEYNNTYYQVYNKAGSGYFTLMKTPNCFDVSMTYEFLSGAGENGYAADYTGMALAYREHLIEEGVLSEKETPQINADSTGDIPMRVDFVMSDVKKSVVGTEQVVTTDVDGVEEILDDLAENGIMNINSGLIGWQKGAETLAKPWKMKFTGKIGSKSDFKKLIADFADKGIDISYSRDFVTINEKMLSYYTNSAKHINTWYLNLNHDDLYPENAPIHDTGYALPAKTAKWIEEVAGKVEDYSSSLTVTGASNILTGSFDRTGVVTSLSEAKDLIENAFSKADEKLDLNLENPNQYLWKYTSRYLQAPVGTSQYVYETDSIPFLQMVLHGTMEVYAPYSNFSFYTDKDILRMIDYNLYPSFVFTKEPSYLLADTVSSDMYSTQYEQYKSLSKTVYDKVNAILKQVEGLKWVGREVVENGVIANLYKDGSSTVRVIINYTDNEVSVSGNSIDAVSAKVIRD